MVPGTKIGLRKFSTRTHFTMFNISTRLQYAANKAMTASTIVAGIVIVLTLIQLYNDNVWNLNTTAIDNINVITTLKTSSTYGSVNRKPKENSKVNFDLKTDLTPLFNWNTKQVFVYLTATYPGKSPSSSNKVTYWDKIITSKEDAVLDLSNVKSKYSVWDVENSFRERDAVLSLEWNIQPWIGPLIFGETKPTTGFKFKKFEKKVKA